MTKAITKPKSRVTVPKRTNLYARLAKYTPHAIRKLVNLMESKNEGIRLRAIQLILAKTIPDLKAETDESTTPKHRPIQYIAEQNLTQFVNAVASSNRDTSEPNKIQDVSLAQESKENIDSTRVSSVAGTQSKKRK